MDNTMLNMEERRSSHSSDNYSDTTTKSTRSLASGSNSRRKGSEIKSEQLPKGKRRHAPKVRTGCLSCKRRRVKCDEEKPQCKRCLISGTQCDGYYKPEPPKAPRLLMQREISAIGMPVSLSSKVHCQNETQNQYFQQYKAKIGPKLGGAFQNKVWDNIMVQACFEERFVLDGLLAISAMTACRTSTREDKLIIAAEHNEFAFKQYQLALQRMETEVDAEKCPRIAIIASLITCCFEALSCNVMGALARAQNGHNLLQQWLSRNPYPNHTRAGISSPAPHTVEHDLVQAALFFDVQLLQHFDSRPIEVHQVLKHEGSDTMDRMPHNFTDVEEAKAYWQLAQRRASHFVWEATASVNSLTAAPSYVSPNSYSAISPYAPHLNQHVDTIGLGLLLPGDQVSSFELPFRYRTPTPNLVDYHLEHQQYSTENLRWRLAFSSLYSRLKKSTNPVLIMAANILFIQSISSEINLSTTLVGNDSSHHLNDFREVVLIARQVVGTRKKDGGCPEFVFEDGITQALFMVVRFCRDEVLRREAVAILRWFGCREGAWDCLLLVELEMQVV